MTFFEELKSKIEVSVDSNFNFNQLNMPTKILIKELCDLIDEKLVDKANSNICSCESKDTVNYGKFDQCLDCGLPKQ